MSKLWRYVASSVFIGSVTYGLIKYFNGRVCTCVRELHGFGPVIITGANSGIGKALAIELGRRGATLILACRDLEKGDSAKLEIAKAVRRTKLRVFVKHLDLCSIESIKKFADSIQSEFRSIFALVNCAGVFYHPQELTEDGFDVTFQTNYLGPFVLTHYLYGHLKQQTHARIVNVSSEAHRKVSVSDLASIIKDQSAPRTHMVAYGVSKLALNLFTREFGRLLSINSKNVTINAANPGNVQTGIYVNFPLIANHWLFAIQEPIRHLVVQTPEQGCQTILHTLLVPDITWGKYYSTCRITAPSPISRNDSIAGEYYQITRSLLCGYRLRKTVLTPGRWGEKPYEGSGVKLNIPECPGELIPFAGQKLVVGESGGLLGRVVDSCVCTMHLGEQAQFSIPIHNQAEIDVVFELVELDFNGYIYQWDAGKKFQMAVKRKDIGKRLFQENHLFDAAHIFAKAFKLVCSIPIPVEHPPEVIDNVNIRDIKALKETLYNNMSACYFRHQDYDCVIPLCQNVLNLNPANVKALFKIGVAFEHERDFEFAYESLVKVLELEPGNKAAAEHLEAVKAHLKKANLRVSCMMKKMILGTIGK